MAVPSDFAARVRAGRAYADLSREELAAELGMSVGYVKNIENGKGLKDLEAVSLLERLPEITGLPRSFFQPPADTAQPVIETKLDAIDELIRAAVAANAARVAEVMQLLEDRLPPSEESRRRRPA